MHAPVLFPGLFAYVGIGPGPEFIPYFAALMSLVGAAAIAVLQWVVSLMLSCFPATRRRRSDATANAADASHSEAARCERSSSEHRDST